MIHVVGIVGTPLYIYYHGITSSELALFAACLAATGMSTTAGYHRLFAHATYKAASAVRFLLLLFGAAGFQESALKWASQHRQHHLYTDTAHDPYGVHKGFWHAHIGWILLWRHRANYENVKDLRRSRLVSHQHDHYAWWSVGGGVVLPMLIAFWIGHPLGGIVMSVCLRIVSRPALGVLRQFVRAHVRHPALRAHAVGARQLGWRAVDQRRGLPQFPPSLSDRLSQRHSLVRLGPDQVVHLFAVPGRTGMGPAANVRRSHQFRRRTLNARRQR